MKIFLIPQIRIPHNINRNINSCIAFTGISDDLGSDKFQYSSNPEINAKIESVQKVKYKLLVEFSDRVEIESKGLNVEIPNCIMLIDKSAGTSENFIDWLGESSDCNFVKLADADNDTLQRGLWDTLVKAGEIFEATKRRTLIHVEGFDRLITAATNAPESIAALKEVMCCCAQDFGSTIIFKTKDPSKLVVETIQPHRVTAKIDILIQQDVLNFYNDFMESMGLPVIRAKNAAPSIIPAPVIAKDKATHEADITPQAAEPNLAKTEEPKTPIDDKPTASEAVRPTQMNETAEIEPIETEPGNKTSIEMPKISPKSSEEQPVEQAIKQEIKEMSNSAKALKIFGVLILIGGAAAGIFYWIRNKKRGVKENANQQSNISKK
ncbi:MAG: hypothetical protein PHC64_07495 [Candidatus Gastranaerophilales bacterium]|nr:hypothetical protein [Candidatus Gastranaerophilales bacterium]